MAFSIRSFFNSEDPQSNPLKSPDATESHPSNSFLFKVAQAGAHTPNPFASSPISSPEDPPSGLRVADVLASIPAELVSDTPPPSHQTLQLSNEIIDRSLEGGHARLALQDLQKVSPNLFRQPLAEDESRFISLSPDKVLLLLQLKEQQNVASMATDASEQLTHNPFSIASPLTQQVHSPFTSESSVEIPPAALAQTETVEANLKEPTEPTVSVEPQLPTPKKTVLPPQRHPATTLVGNPLDRIQALRKQSRSTSDTPAPPIQAPEPTVSDSSMHWPLRYVLQHLGIQELGMDPYFIPESVVANINPQWLLRQQELGHAPSLSIEELKQAVDPQHHILLSGASPKLKFLLPLAAPDASPNVEVTSTITDEVVEDTTPAIEPESLLNLPDADPFQSVPDTPNWAQLEDQNLEKTTDEPFNFPPIPGLSKAHGNAATPQNMLAPPVNEPAQVTAPPLALPAPVQQVSATTTVNVAPPIKASLPTKLRRTLLRVVLGIHHDVSEKEVFEILAQLPGIQYLACIANDTNVCSASSSSHALNQVLETHSVEIARHCQALHLLTGGDCSDTFSVHKDQLTLTLLVQDHYQMLIQHDQETNTQESIEKILLVSNEIAPVLISQHFTA